MKRERQKCGQLCGKFVGKFRGFALDKDIGIAIVISEYSRRDYYGMIGEGSKN